MNLKILIATHKKYRMPDDPAYLPVQAGAAINPRITEYQADDQGSNISRKNPNFCELTCLYWAWKNLDADFLGLVHYRRHFAGCFAFSKRKRIANSAFLQKLLQKHPLIAPAKRHYFIESNYSQYLHAHNQTDLQATRNIIAGKYPDYLADFDRVMKRTSGTRFNMFIMRRDLAENYCAWLFDILFELEKQLDISNYSPYDARVFGFVGERLFDVWMEKNQLPVKRLPVINLENQHFIRKISRFLLRKISGGRIGRQM